MKKTAEYAEDTELRCLGQTVFNRLVFHIALNSWRGLTGASQGRTYLEQQAAPDETSMATLAQVCWGDGHIPRRLSLGTVLLAAGDVRLPSTITAVGQVGLRA